jgi:sRNA-binding protein
MTTERYDSQKLENLQTAVVRLESRKTFDPSDTKDAARRVDDGDRGSSVFQDQAKVRAQTRCARPEIEAKEPSGKKYSMSSGRSRVNRVVPVAVNAMAFQTQSGHLRVRHGDTARIATAIELRSDAQS